MLDSNNRFRAMPKFYGWLAIGFLCLVSRTVATAADGFAESWKATYSGRDATGPHVLGYWPFDKDQKMRDASGRGHDLTLAGAVWSAEGKFGGALESAAGWPVADQRHAAYAPAKPDLSPQGAFTLEMWIKPKLELAANLSPVLVDKKYVADSDYQFRLTTADKSGLRRLQVLLGFGKDSQTFYSDQFALGTDWQHVAFTYNAAGEVRFFRNGAPLGRSKKAGRGPIVPGRHVFSIGDRVGSYYAGFPGLIDQVRLCNGALEFRPVSVAFQTERTTYRRMEQAPPIGVIVRNLTQAPAKNLKLKISIEGLGERSFPVPQLEAGESHEVAYSFNSALRPDVYRVKAALEMPGEPPFVSEEFLEITLAARPLVKMPVMMWGLGSPQSVVQEMDRLKDLGFTHCLGGRADYDAIWSAKKPIPPQSEDRITETKRMLDFALAENFGIAFALSPGHWLKERKELQRINRMGQPYSSRPDVNAALPGLAEFCFNVGASVAEAYDHFPAWQAALLNTETRDSSQVSFSEFDRAAYRKFSGQEIPAEVAIKNGVQWGQLKNFPKDRMIPDDHPILKFYRWFWNVGDGWNNLNTALHRGIHSTGRDDVWTWFDPAIRVPSLGGSGGEVDVLGQWTYTNPDPLRIGYFSDELFAMATNSPQHPRVMKMTQLFWYRTQSAPQKKGADHIPSPFDDHDPDAAYITISPMHLRESFWTKLARPVSGLMYHGWQALVPTDSPSGYRYTHPDTKDEFRRLHRGVLEPLGPSLLQVGDHKSDVAYLDSFTSQMFARRGSYGYSGEEAYLTLLHAQLQPQVIYEEQILKEEMAGFKLLILANCDVLTESVVKKIQEFQKRGGLVVGDENLAPAITPDIRMDRVVRKKQGKADHAAILASAAKLRRALPGKYHRPTDSTNPEIITRLRGTGTSDYVFVVNDAREFGTYVGQHGLVMENGLPSTGEVSLRREAGNIYDLIAGREVKSEQRNGRLHWPVSLGPCEGGVFLVTPAAIDALHVESSKTARCGDSFPVTITVADDAGKPIPAVLPMLVEISDPAGRLAEFSGYYGAKGGQLKLKLDLAANDRPGVWQIRVRELASRRESTASFRVTATPPQAD